MVEATLKALWITATVAPLAVFSKKENRRKEFSP